MAWAAPADVDRFDEAVDWFRKRKVTLPNQLTPQNAADSFWVGAGLELAQIESVFDRVATAIENGEDFATWRERVRGELLNDAHAETVFRNAAQRSYNAGRWEQMRQPDVLQFRPFWIFDAILDDRTTTICEICNETIRPADDEWWNGHIPPLHHRCRSSIRNLRRSEAERLGVTTQGPDTSGVRPPGEWGAPPTEASTWRPEPKDETLARELKKKQIAKLPSPAKKRRPSKPKTPSLPPLTVEPGTLSREKAKQLLDSLRNNPEWSEKVPGNQGYGSELRLWAQEQLRKLGVEPGRRPLLGVYIAENESMADAEASAHTTGNTKGLVVLQRKYFNQLTVDLEDFASGKAKEVPSLRAILHEEIHLATRAEAYSYDGENVSSLIEEVTTELMAHEASYGAGVYRDRLRIKINEYGSLWVTRYGGVAYTNQIVDTVRDIVAVTGWDYDTATDRVIQAGIAMRTDSAAGKSHFGAFMQSLQVDNEAQRDKIRAALEDRRL